MQPDANTILFFEGDRTAIKEVYRTQYKRCEDFILRKNGTVEDAKDCFQEAIISTYYTGREPCLNGGVAINKYLFGALKKSWFKLWRKEYEVRNEVGEIIKMQPILENELQQFVVMAFVRLDDRCKDIIAGYYAFNVKLKDIAEDYGFSSQRATYIKAGCLENFIEFYGSYVNGLIEPDSFDHDNLYIEKYLSGSGSTASIGPDILIIQTEEGKRYEKYLSIFGDFNRKIEKFIYLVEKNTQYFNEKISSSEKKFLNNLLATRQEGESDSFPFEPSNLEEGEIDSQ